MRSQQEIIDRIQRIAKDKSDPYEIQHQVLVRKLSWENAKPYINPKHRTDEQRNKWKETSRLDPQALKEHVKEMVDKACCDICSEEFMDVFFDFQISLVLLWLHGPSRESTLRQFLEQYIKASKQPLRAYRLEKPFEFLCEEFGWKWRHFKARYETSIVTPERRIIT